jgi:long-chain acyl-CoA synthetase
MNITNHNKTAIIAGDMQVTYQMLIRNILAYSEQFPEVNGERMVIFGENRTEWIYAFYAAWQNGYIPVPVDFMSAPADIAYIINDCKPSIVFCSETLLPTLNEAIITTSISPSVILFENVNLINNDTEKELKSAFGPDDTAVIIYTSGTTGSPKGVMLTYDNLQVNVQGVTQDVKIFSKTDRVLILLPLHHIFPLMGSMIAPLESGGTVVISPSLSPEDIAKSLYQNKVTLVIGVPRFYNMLRKGIKEKINKSSLARALFLIASVARSKQLSKFLFKTVQKKFGGHIRYLVCGGAALDRETALDLTTLGFEILEGYGMTEAAPMITFTRPGNYIPGSGGHALPVTRIEIRDGEIVASGRNIMKGYYDRPLETSEILKDGWLYTGDLGEIDKKGFVFVTGRKKEIIVLSNGKNINPELIEKAISEKSQYVREAGVFMLNDMIQALIVPDIEKMGADGILDYEHYFRAEVIEKLNKETSPYKRVMKFYLSTVELPKTRLGKVQRFRLAEIASTGNNRDKKPEINWHETDEYKVIREYLEKETGEKVYPTDRLGLDIALDSLSKITLLVFLENSFGVKIPEDKLMNHGTVKDLSSFVNSIKTRSEPETVDWAAILKEKVHLKLPRTQFTLNLINTFSKITLNVFFRIRGEGKSNIPKGPCIIAPNHQSFFDGFFVASFLDSKTMNKTYVYAKEKYWRLPWMRFMASRNNIILMDINKDLKSSLQKMAAVLKKGKNIIIFPEGTRSINGQLGQYKKTFAILSRELNIPVVPVVIDGSHKALPVGAWFPRPFRKVSVKFLQPVYPLNHTYDSLKDTVRQSVSGYLAK